MKYINGKYIESTPEEIAAMQKQAELAEMQEKARPLTAEEVTRLIIRQQVNSLSIDDATASRMVDYFPELKQDGSLVKAGTRINWHGILKQAAVDLWDTAENNPDSAPTLWAEIQYRSGYRIIPETITVTTAFAEGEYGWWGDVLYRSKVDANVYTPEQYPANWEAVSV
ncbi:MAG: hypothetical protein ACI3WQ_10865 [Faecousia sp.]